jgi:hypothetical protein
MVHFLFLKFFRPFLILIFKNLFFKLLKKFNTKLINLILNIHHKYATHTMLYLNYLNIINLFTFDLDLIF